MNDGQMTVIIWPLSHASNKPNFEYKKDISKLKFYKT